MSGNHRQIIISNNFSGFYTVTIQSSKDGDDIRDIAREISRNFDKTTRWDSTDSEHVKLTLPSGHIISEEQLRKILITKTNHDCTLEIGGNNPELEGHLHHLLRKAERDARRDDASFFQNGNENKKFNP